MSMQQESLLKFPCQYPLKVMGLHSDEFRSLTLGIVTRHAGAIDSANIEERPSRDGKYLSLTYIITATSREQLDSLYRELTSCEKVRIVL